MKQILLLVQSQADVAALPVASSEIKKLGTKGVWLIFSPSILTDTATASRQHDIAIADIEEAIRDCAKREDFEGAKNYKAKRDGAILDKAESVKTAYKRMTKEEQDAAYSCIFKGFINNPPAPNIKVTQLSDHYDTGNWIELLNSMRGAWFAPFAPGTFAVTWASSITATTNKAVGAPVASSADAETARLAALFEGVTIKCAGLATASNPKAARQPAPVAPPPVDSDPVSDFDPDDFAAPPAVEPSSVPQKTMRPNQTKEFRAITSLREEGIRKLAVELGVQHHGLHHLKVAYMIFNQKYPNGIAA